MNQIEKSLTTLDPILRFVKKSSFSSYLLFSAAFLALVLANSPAHSFLQALLSKTIGFTIGNFEVYKSLLLWINDGLMSVFFFVVGLELKRELIAGQLSNPKNVAMPIVGAIGGMLIPAIIFSLFTAGGSADSQSGWGIPMATDIAFALGVLYLLGPKVPIQLKVFLTALAIIDDIGAVSVVAFFYTEQISFVSLIIGGSILSVMFLLNKLGVRRVLIYAVLGIGGVWLAFLLSGVHATIAAVLAAFAIPATREIDKEAYLTNLAQLQTDLKVAKSAQANKYLLSADEENIIGEITRISNASISPLQRLEHSMHSLVLYIVMPIFALANAGVVIDSNWFSMLMSPVSLGVFFGLILGKLVGVFGLAMLGVRLNWYKMPKNLTKQMVLGVSFLAAIGFTMSLFINTLAFENPMYIEQAKMGVLTGSLVAGLLGYFILKKELRKTKIEA
ncbi:MAG: Na+/H+ antiporter NhaA [Schleiferiaceae bacterium]|nr:Na+/H+ antiporter NhaA [Schleiferiaceae bacterium]